MSETEKCGALSPYPGIDACVRNEGHTGDHGYGGVFWPLYIWDTKIKEAEARGRVAALKETRDAWQWKGWADVLLPVKTNPIAQAQIVTDWLTARFNQELDKYGD